MLTARRILACLTLAASIGSPAYAQPPAAELLVTPTNQQNLDPTPRLEFSGGHIATFLIQNLGSGGVDSADARVLFQCSAFGSVAATTCPAPIWLAPNGDTATVTVTLTMGLGGSPGWMTLTATPDPNVISGPGSTGRRDYTVVAAAATWTPNALTDTVARGQSRVQAFTLTNTGTLPTSYAITDVVSDCSSVLTGCSRSPAATGQLAVGGMQPATVSYTGAVAATRLVSLIASVGTHMVVVAPLNLAVVDATVVVSPGTVVVAAGVAAASYAGFTVTNDPGSPDATYDVRLTGCTGVTACRFPAGGTATTVPLSLTTPSVALPILFDVPSTDSGTVTMQVAYRGTVLNSATLSVRIVRVMFAPTVANASVLSGSTGNTFNGFTLTNRPNSPASVVSLDFPQCTGVTSCRFSNGSSTTTITLAQDSTAVVPIVYNAPSPTAGTIRVRARYSGTPLDSATLTVTVAAANTATIVANAPNPQFVGPGQTLRTQTFVLTNLGPSATFSMAHNCATMPAPAAAVSCTAVPVSVGPLATNATANVGVDFTGGATKGVQSTLTLQGSTGGTPVASGSATIIVPNASVTPPVPLTVLQNSAYGTSFVVRNLGPGTVPYHLTSSCAGSVTVCSVLSATPVTLTPAAPGDTATVSVTLTGTALGAGTVTLDARLQSSTGPVIASSTVNVTVNSSVVGMSVLTANLTGDSLLARDQCVAIALGADLASECGDLRIVHALPAVRTMNIARAPVLSYLSGHARPFPVVPAHLTQPVGTPVPTAIAGALKINGITRATGSWTPAAWTAGATRRVVLGFDAAAAGLATGVYPYVFEVTTTYAGGSAVTSATGKLVIVNRSTSEFGAGWWLSGLEQLDLAVPASPVWIGGNGSVRVYTQRAGSVAPNRVWGAASISYPDSIREVGSQFVRQLPDSVWVTFDAQGRHLSTRNRQGHVTTFTYGAGNRLATIVLPPTASPLTYTFTYTGGGKLSSVAAPGSAGSRTVTVTINAGNGRVQSITDPGTPTRTVTFAYGTGHRVTSRTNGRGAVTTFAYDSASRVARDSLAMGSTGVAVVHALTNWQAQGWPTTGSVDPTSVALVHTGPIGGVTTFTLNQHGAPTLIRDALGQTTTLVRDPVMPGLVTLLTTPAGHSISAAYDGRGRIQSQSSASTVGTATTTYQWDGKWDQIAKITRPEGDFVEFGVDPGTGNRLWQQDTRGTASRTTFGYNGNNQLLAVTPPGNPTEDYTYDAKGNLDSYANGLDMLWRWTNDAIGLTTQTQVPAGTGNKPTWSPHEITTLTYSARNQELTNVKTAGGQSITQTKTYDAEDNLLSVARSWTPNPQGIATQTTSYGYDNADRVTTQTESSGGTQTTGYDAAGNVISLTTRRGDMIGMGYDLLNRMTSRSIPSGAAFAYPNPSIFPNKGIENAPYAYNRPAESQAFTYHPTGQIESATGLDASISRGYHPSGVLMSETQSIKSRDRLSTHSYSVSYAYDRNDRRRTMSLTPGNLFPGSAMTYSYSGWGALSAVNDIGGNSYSFSYNGRDELTNVGYPAGVSQTLNYDAAGRLTSDNITQPSRTGFPYVPGSGIRGFSVSSRNARGQILAASDNGTFATSFPGSQQYDPMGHVTKTTLTQSGYVYLNGQRATFYAGDTLSYDALGNMLTNSGYYGVPPFATSFSSSFTYNSANRLATRSTSQGSATTVYQYDAAGTVRFETTTVPNSGGTFEERASFYDGSDRIVAVDQRKSGKTVLDEFRYDPLGRRVWVSNTTACATGTSDISCLTSGVRRIIWDGDREVAEIHAPRDTTNLAMEELDQNFPVRPYVALPMGQYGDRNTHFGRVVYSPGLAIDQPMSVTRYEYQDQPSTGASLTWPTFTLMILWDYRGTAAWGMFTDGAWARPYQMSGGQTACPTPGIGGTDRCVLMQWQVQQSAFDQARGNVQEVSWMGSLLRSKRDGTGLEYKRARVYDPRTGRFTQEDPIGLAGGLNLYGFANGDPVNFSDPFGLQGCPKYSFETPSGMCLSAPAALGAAITMAFQSAATAFRALRSGATAEGVAASRAGARNVGEQLAYQELAPGVAGNAGIEIAGGASKAQFRGAAAYAERYGGDASDWVKKSTTGSHAGSGGNVYQLHWVQNLRTGQIVDVKLKSYARMH